MSDQAAAVPKKNASDTEHTEVTHTSQDFIKDIKDRLDAGYGFVPFIGAGLSAPSGVPLIREWRSYLHRCIGLALGVDEEGALPWVPRIDKWPPFYDRERIKLERDKKYFWEELVRNKMYQLRESGKNDARIFQEALGAMAEWRTSLLFLSRLIREREWGKELRKGKLALDAPDQQVIDACIDEVLSGKQPTLGHRMLAANAGLLRMDVVLTTNFVDDLLERAFEEARNPFTVFEIHLSSNLPAYNALAKPRSLIKLHGNRHSLRADYTLDTTPTETDRWRFLEYLLSANGRACLAENQSRGEMLVDELHCQNHLMMVGVSATEPRTLSFIKHAWNHLKGDFRVFWVCFTDDDVQNVKDFTKSYYDSHNKKETDPTWEGSIILRHSDPGLLFLEIYQTIRHCFPRSGILFPSPSRMAIPPILPTSLNNLSIQTTAQEICAKILDRIKKFNEPEHRKNNGKLLVVTSAKGIVGVTDVCASAFEKLRYENNCLWIDMNDTSSSADVFEKLIDAAYFKLGTEQWMPVYIPKDTRSRAREMRRISGMSKNPWIIFLNARETPGANRPKDEYKLYPNGWLDNAMANDPDDAALDDNLKAETRDETTSGFLELLRELCGTESENISVILMCRTYLTSQTTAALINEVNKLRPPQFSIPNDMIVIDKPCASFDEENTWELARVWIDNDDKKRRFLYGLSLLQRPRFLSTIWSEALIDGDNDNKKEQLCWITALEKKGLIRWKPGGFIWMYSTARNNLRKELENSFGTEAPRVTAEIHQLLADWYHRVLAASQSPQALFEAIYHACKSAVYWIKVGCENADREKYYEGAATQISWGTSLLLESTFMVKTQGYSRGSCRTLEYIHKDLCHEIEEETLPMDILSKSILEHKNRIYKNIKMLKLRCLKVMRDIAREVGELPKAFERQKKIIYSLQRPPRLNKVVGYRWNAMLHVRSRSYCHAYAAICRAFDAMENKKTSATYRKLERIETGNINEWINKISQALNSERIKVVLQSIKESEHPLELKREVLRLIELTASLLLLSHSTVTRSLHIDESSRNKLKSRSEELFKNIIYVLDKIVAYGHELANEIISQDRDTDDPGSYFAETMLLSGRLKMHESICSTISQNKSNGRFDVGMNLLVQAEYCLHKPDGRRMDSDIFMIELHRADIRLRQADTVVIPIYFAKFEAGKALLGERNMNEMCDVFRKHGIVQIQWRDDAEKLRKEVFNTKKLSSQTVEALRKAKSYVDDAARSLKRAEEILTQRRRNVWWTTWLFSRQLRVIAMSIWCTLHEEGSAIPFLGLESCPRKTDTLADKLLENTRRMIRNDSYRFATVLETYLDCALAFRARLLLDSKAIKLQDRQENMRQKIKDAIDDLEKIKESRKNENRKKGKQVSTLPDSWVELYVDGVLAYARTKVSDLEITIT